jgi:hypothetical protein
MWRSGCCPLPVLPDLLMHPAKLDRSLPAVRAHLRPYVHVSDHIQDMLGAPDEDKSWYPAQAWIYRGADSRQSMCQIPQDATALAPPDPPARDDKLSQAICS